MEAPGTADGSLCRGFAWFYWLFGRRGTDRWMSFDVAFGANRYMEFREVPDLVACARRGAPGRGLADRGPYSNILEGAAVANPHLRKVFAHIWDYPPDLTRQRKPE